MRPLPPLPAGTDPPILLMADRSAVVLLDAILAADAGPPDSLAEQLAVDPPLVLWAVCAAARVDGFRPRSLDDVSRWLSRHLPQALRWDDFEDRLTPVYSGRGVDQSADLVAHVLQVAELAALLAAAADQRAAEEAFLLGVLHDASRWPAFNVPDASEPLAACLPLWLVDVEESPATRRVGEAVSILAGQSASAPGDFDPEACRHRASEARQSWLEAVDTPLLDRLPALTARLGRLAQLEDRFQEALEAEKLEAMAEFSAGAGHEINNPLAIIGGWAQLLLKDETDPERRRQLALMNAQVKRAHEMIADVRLFARPPKPEPETVELVELVDRVLADLAPQAAERATSLVRSGLSAPVTIEADPAQLSVALHALCKNSLEAIGRDGHVEVALGRLDGKVEIRVSDDGAGILPEHRHHLFEPFYSARQAGRGLGFGLSKCWRIVTNHGGRIDVRSEPGEGAEFTVTLPERWSG